MRYYITIKYNKKLHLDLLTRSSIGVKGRTDTMSFIFDAINDNDSDLIINALFNNI